MIDNEALREQYNPDGSDLRRIQLRMLEILKCVDSICERHKIRYWLSSGTLLGAVRHGGFIPWDDDLDIELLREDYLRLMRILPKELPNEYVLQTYDSDPDYVYLYAKVRDRNSFIEERFEVNRHFKYQGVFIDIFVLEPSFEWLAKIARVLFNRLCFGLALRKGAYRWLYRANRLLLLRGVFPLFRLLSKGAPSHIVGNTFGVNFPKRRDLHYIFPLKRIQFEDGYFYAPADTDHYLRSLYGDYMRIPEIKETHVLNSKIKIW